MQTVLLVRHAESTANQQGIVCADPGCSASLTEEGRRQAAGLGRQLQGEEIALCVTSQLARAVETADIALEDRSTARFIDARFNDPLAGQFEHSPVSELNEWLARNGPAVRTLGGESQHDAMARYAAGYEALLGRGSGLLLAVIHRLPILWLLSGLRKDAGVDVEFASMTRLEGAEVSTALAELASDPRREISY